VATARLIFPQWLAILYGVMVVVAGALFAIETSDTFGKAVSSAVAGFWIIVSNRYGPAPVEHRKPCLKAA